MNLNPLTLHNRIAVAGEKSVTHRFKSGTLRMVPYEEFERWLRMAEIGGDFRNIHQARNPIWTLVKQFFANCTVDFLTLFGFIDSDALPFDGEPAPIVEIPSDALLRICDIPPSWRDQYHFRLCEEAFFAGVPVLRAFPMGRCTLEMA